MNAMHDVLEGHKPEPIPGLPDHLPPGERILWQGAPDWTSLFRHVFHARAVAVYFTALATWRIAAGVSDGTPAAEIAIHAAALLPVAAAALGLLALLAWLIARSTIYTITNARVVIRAGVALPKAINVPFKVVGSAALRMRENGAGDIPLQLTGPDRAAYLHLWPHARPWRFNRAEPMLRGVPDAAAVADILSRALAEKAGQTAPRITVAASAPARAAVSGRAAAANT